MKPLSPAHESHFLTAEQQTAAATSGIWVFLLTELMFFGAVFSVFLISWHLHPGAFFTASRTLNRLLGTVNTSILLTSSWTMAMAVEAGTRHEKKKMLLNLALTVGLGCVFLGIKGFEWWEEYHKDTFPALGNDTPGPPLFFRLYFIMTGLHGLHVAVGIILISFLAWTTWRRRELATSQLNLTENLGLYWHFVDIVWIFLFPLLYLLDQTG